jgi:hypothetical protein
MVSGTNDPAHPWFAPVTLIVREPASARAEFVRRGRLVPIAGDDVLVVTRGRRAMVARAPLFCGAHGGRSAAAHRTGRAYRGLAGPVPARRWRTGDIDRARDGLAGRRAAGVMTVLDGQRSVAAARDRRRRQGAALAQEAPDGDIEACVSAPAMARLVGGADALAALEAEADRPDFTPHCWTSPPRWRRPAPDHHPHP